MAEQIPTHLLARYLSNEATTGEQEQLFAWVASDVSHQKIFNEWLQACEYELSHQPVSNLANGLEVTTKQIGDRETQEKKERTFFTWRRMAVSAAIFLTAGLSIYLLGKYSEITSPPISLTEHTTAAQQMTIVLSDKSAVTLNTNASLRHPEKFHGSGREVFLKGEAFFDVEHDVLVPFLVHTGELTTRVSDASFNVRVENHQVTVTVASGMVQVMQGNAIQEILPGEKIVYSTIDKKMTRSSADLEQEFAWKVNTIIFDGTRRHGIQKL